MNPFDVGASVNAVAGIAPADSGDAALAGAAVERTQYTSCVMHVVCGAAAGGPSAQSVIGTLEDSADGSTDWVTVATGADLVADDTEVNVDVNFATVRQYVRAVVTIVLTGGTTPTIPVAATLVLGGARTEPV